MIIKCKPIMCNLCGCEMDRINDLLIFCPKCGKVIPLKFGLIPTEHHYEVFDGGDEFVSGFFKQDKTDFEQ